jgi:phage regulator Rha-like protein
MKKRAQITPPDSLETRILTVRGQKVILDSDLAAIYGVETKALNRAVKRNAMRFPPDFVFQLTGEEAEFLRCQFGTSNEGRGGRRFLPYAFTENGAVMAANVLNSAQAVRMSVFVVRAFVRMRELLTGSKELAAELKKLEAKLTSRLDVHESAIADVLRRIMRLLDPPPLPPVPQKSMGFHTTMKRPGGKRTSQRPDVSPTP